MSVATALELAVKRLEFEAVVGELLEESKVESGQGRATAASLLATVEGARHDRERTAVGTSPYSTRSVTRLGALDLLARIDRTVGARPHGRAAAVRTWSVRVAQSIRLGELADLVEEVSAWVAIGRGLFEPARWLPIRGTSCPACDTARVRTPDDSGQEVVDAALRADTRSGWVSCWSADCGASWGPAELEHLARVLEQQGVETLAVDL